MKRKNEVQLWIGNPGDSAPQKVATKTIDGDLYIAKPTDAIYLVAPTAKSEMIPYGYVSKMKYIPASLWENEISLIYGEKAPKECGA